MPNGLDLEFNARIKHNFNLYVLITSKNIDWEQDVILESIYRLNGYKCHKTVRYGMNSSHIHVKFNEERFAREAVDYLNLNTNLTAILLDDMMRDWFKYEMKSGFSPPWTLTIVDIIGTPPFSLNFLTEHILNSIFRDFGKPYILPYTAALNEPHVQILFGSMSEALAACMAFGEWYEKDKKMDSFFYRVRINPSDKEAMLIKNSGGIPNEAFKLDYFVSVRKEVVRNQKISESDAKQKMPRIKCFQNKGAHKNRKQKPVPVDAEVKNSLTQIGHRTPILCIPVIAPLNSYTEDLMTTNKRFKMDFTNSILNIQQTCAVSAQDIDMAVIEADFPLSIQYEKEASCSGKVASMEQFHLPLEHETLDRIQISGKPALVPPKQTRSIVTRQKRSVHKWNTRTFERST